MSLLNKLKPRIGSKHIRKRVGRGRGSGLGQTAGMGHKGQLARAGGRVRRGFEGGQTPLIRRLPKFGFKCPSRVEYKVISLQFLERIGDTITRESLIRFGFELDQPLKILGNAPLSVPLVIKGIKISSGARAAVEAAGGRVEG